MKKLLGFFVVIIPIIAILVVVLTSTVVGDTVDIAVESVDITTESGVMALNTSFELEYEIYPKQAQNREVLFTSSDENIATIDQEGVVNFIGCGTVFISVTTIDGNKTESCEFSVESDSVYGINLTTSKKELSLTDNTTAEIKATVYPRSAVNKEILFYSSDTSVATVNANGIVSPVGLGSVTITATSADGDISQSISLEVTQKATSLTLSADKVVSESGYVTLTPSFAPSNAVTAKYKSLTYSTSDSTVATVTRGGQVIFLSPGDVTVTASTSYGITSSIKLYYTGGLPSSFECEMPSEYKHLYDENDLSKNNGNINIDFPDESSTRNVTFTSSNERVVTVDEHGAFSVRGGGTALITVTVKTAQIKNGELVFEDGKYEIDFEVERKAVSIVAEATVFITGASYDINASVLPTDTTIRALSYRSTNSVATVDNDGIVTFLSAGTAVIEISTANGLTKLISVTSSFGYPTGCIVGGLTDSYLPVGATTLLTAVFAPSTAVHTDGTWSVSDNSIASIDLDGKLTALSQGTVTVNFAYTAWDNASSNTYPSVTSATITVYKLVQSLVLDTPLEVYGNRYVTAKASFDINYGLSPSDVTADVVFHSKNPDVASIDANSGKVYFKKIGVAEFYAVGMGIKNSISSTSVFVEYTGGAPKLASLNIDKDNLWLGESITVSVNASTVIPADSEDLSFTISQRGAQCFAINGLKLTAVGAGTTSVTATFINGSSVSFNATVKQPVEDIELFSGLALDNVTAKSVVRLSAVTKPTTAANKAVSFISSDVTIATVNETGEIVFLTAGSVTVTATADDGRGATSSITIRSTCGNVERIELNESKIIQNVALSYIVYPADVTGAVVNPSIVSQSPQDGVSEDVLVLRSGAYYGNWAGTAVVRLSVTNADGCIVSTDKDVEVVNVACNVTSFSVSDLTVYENDSNTISIDDIVTDIVDKTLEPLFVKYIEPVFSVSADTSFIEIVDGTLYAKKYGKYTVTVTIENTDIADTVRTFDVTVKTSSTNIEFKALSDANIAASTLLSRDNGVIVSGSPTVVLGEASLIDERNPNFDVEFSYFSSDSSVAVVNGDGVVTFLRGGEITVYVSQTIAEKGIGSAAADGSGNYDFEVSVHYYEDTLYFDTYVGETKLSETTPFSVTYSESGNNNIVFNFDNFVPKNPDYQNDVTVMILSQSPNAEGGRVLALNNGVLSAVGGGSGVVNVTVNGCSYEFGFTVNRKVTSVTLGADILTANKVIQLDLPLMSPSDATDKTYTFSSSDDTVAAISNGNILTFVKAGVVTVTATANDGSGISDSITVRGTFEGIYDFTLTDNSVALNKGDSYTVSNLLSPANASKYSFTYAISANNPIGGVGNVATVSSGGTVIAFCGGTATITVRAENAFGDTITRTLAVNVYEPVTTLSLTNPTITDIDISNNYITSLSTVALSAEAGSVSATNKTLIWTSGNAGVATVDQNGNVTFSTPGTVTITVASVDNPALSRSVGFRYTGTKPYSATINAFSKTLSVGDSLTISASNVVPVDLSVFGCTVETLSSSVNGGGSGNVLTITGNTISAVAGGTARIRVSVNGYTKNDFVYDITVKSPMTSITATETVTLAMLSSGSYTYQIDAVAAPAHTHENLVYEVLSGSGVSVDAKGLVTLTVSTSAVIRVRGSESSTVFKDISISYTQMVLESIEIEPMNKVALFSGVPYTLTVFAHYDLKTFTLDNTDVTFINNTPSLYSIDTNGKLTAKTNANGTATVTATFEGKQYTYQFVVAPIVSSLALELHSSGDNLGIKGERVFGTRSFISASSTSLSDITPYYQMRLSSTTNTNGATLSWSSSDESVATVDNNGVVNRLRAGSVTITCKPLYQYDGESTSYTFKLVYGLDVYNINQYELFSAELSANESRLSASTHIPPILHTDIIYTSAYVPNFWRDSAVDEGYRSFRGLSSIYGNGHTIDASNAKHSSYIGAIAFHISENDVLVDNVTLIGCAFDENSQNLADFKDTSVTVSIRSNNRYDLHNVTIANSVIKNGEVNVEVYASVFTLSGCVVKNAYNGNVTMNTYSEKLDFATEGTIKNCVVENSLTPSIDLKVDKTGEIAGNILHVEGNLYLNNWREEDDIPSSLSFSSSDVSSMLKALFSQLQKDNTTKGFFSNNHINLGVSIISLSGATDFVNNGDVHGLDSAPLNGYMTSGTISKYIPLAVGTATMTLYTYSASNLPVLPGMNGVALAPDVQITSSVYPYIRDTSV